MSSLIGSFTRIPLSLLLMLTSIATALFAQTTVGTGSIVGVVSDPSNAVVTEARVTITNVATGQRINVTTNSFGAFNSGALLPGDYKVQVSAQGFSSSGACVAVHVGNTATVNVGLQIGTEAQVVQCEPPNCA
jgi:Carboxypeptidase regulatory-like domain